MGARAKILAVIEWIFCGCYTLPPWTVPPWRVSQKPRNYFELTQKYASSLVPVCPACGSTDWQKGPEGGDGYNIRCTNQHVYTYLPGVGIVDPDRYADEPELATS